MGLKLMKSYGYQTTKKGKPGENWGRKVMDLCCLCTAGGRLPDY